tara:strand:- start:334 stop:609 length:276 start_codon:yes stop_codon:yes gene_type:complete
MRILQLFILILFIGSFNSYYFTNIDDLFIPEDGETSCFFEGFSDDLDDEQSFVFDTVLCAIIKSTFIEQTNHRTIEKWFYVETPPPENSCI